MSLLKLPNEILLVIAQNLYVTDLSSLLRTSHFFATLLTPLLHDIATKEYDGYLPITWAAKRGHEPLCKLLLEKGADIEATDYHGLHKTPLIWAASQNHKNIVKLLLRHGADVHSTGRSVPSETALLQAARAGNIEICRILLKHGASPNFQPKDRDVPESVLHAAARDGPVSLVELLLDNGADVNARENQGVTALHFAAHRRTGRCTVARMLLKAGLDVNMGYDTRLPQQPMPVTPLHIAVINGYDDFAELMIESGVDVNARDGTGCTALHYAVREMNERMFRMLLETGRCDFTIKEFVGENVLDWAEEYGTELMVESFRRMGYEVQKQGNYLNEAGL